VSRGSIKIVVHGRFNIEVDSFVLDFEAQNKKFMEILDKLLKETSENHGC